MNALVTGAGGFLGLYIVEQLVARGDRVRALCRGRYAALDALGVETVQADLRDREAAVAACRGHRRRVSRRPAWPGLAGPWDHFCGINFWGTRHVVDGCLKHGVGRLVYTSSPSVTFDGRGPARASTNRPRMPGDGSAITPTRRPWPSGTCWRPAAWRGSSAARCGRT